MSTTDKPKFIRLITPIGEAQWAHVQKPKPGFKDPKTGAEGPAKYEIEIVFNPEKDPAWKAWAEDIRLQLVALPQQTKKSTDEEGNPIVVKVPKQSPIRREFDEADRPTGRLIAQFKTNATRKPDLFDKFKRPLAEDVLIGNGSQVRVNYSPNVYEGFGGGINFYLNAVQVLELVEFKKKTADAYGFEGEEAPIGEPAQASVVEDDNIPF